ncbi:MAG: hypothetical protein KF912_09880 [Phycisphaeraceae bacterium]|nr:hypothetical protein [Phycisphaeraceae bacterium]MBX3367604.1 hypothetical protein [Phycisphaeraceae bacterium]
MPAKRLITCLFPLVFCIDLVVYLFAGLPVFASDWQGIRVLQIVLASSLIVSNTFAIHHLVRSRTRACLRIAICLGLCNLIGLATWAVFFVIRGTLYAGIGG